MDRVKHRPTRRQSNTVAGLQERPKKIRRTDSSKSASTCGEGPDQSLSHLQKGVREYLSRRQGILRSSTASDLAISRQGQKPHQCSHCKKDIVKEENLDIGTRSLRIQSGLQEAIRAAGKGCLWFQWLVDRLIETNHIPLESESVQFLLIFTTRLDGGGSFDERTRSDLCKVQVVVDIVRDTRPVQRGNLGDFSMWAELGDLAAGSVSTRPFNLQVASPQAFAFANEHLSSCHQGDDDHSDQPCAMSSKDTPIAKPQSAAKPSRLIDAGFDPKSDTIKVVDTNADPNTTVWNYAALSYCWGGKQKVQLRISTLQECQSGLSIRSLPKTIQDAVHVTRSLNLRYLWVDSLCIVQDCSDDKEKEIKRMIEYFENSFVTICAASAKSAGNGFLHTKRRVHHPVGPFSLPFQLRDGRLGSVVLCGQEHAPAEPLVQRAWTLQETMLSKRMLIYTSQYLLWYCTHLLRGDGGPHHAKKLGGAPVGGASVPTLDSAPSISPVCHKKENSEPSVRWQWIVERYTERQLSCPEDKLLAISALASQHSQMYPTSLRLPGRSDRPIPPPIYLAGLWASDIDCISSQLLWSPSDVHTVRCKQYRAPSWSWAAVDGKICHDLCQYMFAPPESRAQLVKHSIQLTTPDAPFGAVTFASISVRGRIRKMPPTVNVGSPQGENSAFDDNLPVVLPDTLADRNHMKHGKEVWLLEIDPAHTASLNYKGKRSDTPKGLALVKLKGSVTYQRLGVFRFDNSLKLKRTRSEILSRDVARANLFLKAPTQLITII